MKVSVPLAPVIGTLLLAALYAAQIAVPMNYSTVADAKHTWSVFYFAFFRWELLVPVAVFCLALPFVGARFRFFGVASEFARKIPLPLKVILMFALFFGFRSQMMYGDGEKNSWLISTQGEWINHKEPLDRFLTCAIYRIGHRLVDMDGATAIALVSCIGGVLFFLGLGKLLRHLDFSGEKQMFVILLMGTGGFVQVFFGNIENYSLVMAALIYYCYELVRYIESPDTSIFRAAFALGLASAVHVMGIAAAPALGYAWLRHGKRDRRILKTIGLGVAGFSLPWLLVVLLLLVTHTGLSGFTLANYGGGDARMFVPLEKVEAAYEHYTMFSWDHFREIINEVLLTAPVIVFLPLFFMKIRLHHLPSRYVKEILIVLSAVFFACIFTFNPDLAGYSPFHVDLGALNEWDLFSIFSVAFTLLAGIILAEIDLPDVTRRFVWFHAIMFSFFHTAFWILFNAKIFRIDV